MNKRERMVVKSVCHKKHLTKKQKEQAVAEMKHINWFMKRTGAYEW